MPVGKIERHRTERIGWLRAAVLGANDGILSTSSLVLGVAARACDSQQRRGPRDVPDARGATSAKYFQSDTRTMSRRCSKLCGIKHTTAGSSMAAENDNHPQ